MLFLKFFRFAFLFPLAHSIVSTPIDSKTREIISEINNNRCVAAESLIKASSHRDKIPTIVHEVYEASEQKVPFILKCVNSLSSIEISYYILKSLHDEMKSQGHSNPVELISVAESVQSEILNQSKPTMKLEAQSLFDKIVLEIDSGSMTVLKTAMIANNFKFVPEIQNLTIALYNLQKNLSDSIMNRLVSESFGRIPAIDIADNIYDGCDMIPQIVTGLLALFDRLSSTQDTNNEAVLRIAKYISLLKKMKNYSRLPKKKKLDVNALVDKLPKCARNLYFAKDLCFINRNTNEHLYASDAQFYFTRRSVFTYALDKIDTDGVWRVEEIDGQFYFQCQGHFKEYLYASTSDRYKGTGKRYVQTWMDDGFLGETSAWSIELDGDWCYLRNENFKEYMYASAVTHGKRRFVFTSTEIDKGSTRGSWQWQIRVC